MQEIAVIAEVYIIPILSPYIFGYFIYFLVCFVKILVKLLSTMKVVVYSVPMPCIIIFLIKLLSY